jgi:hypothetical protein
VICVTLMVEFARELGLPMGSVLHGSHFGWTTDREKAETMKGRGASVEWVPSHDPRPEARRFDGWEIHFPIGAELDA